MYRLKGHFISPFPLPCAWGRGEGDGGGGGGVRGASDGSGGSPQVLSFSPYPSFSTSWDLGAAPAASACASQP